MPHFLYIVWDVDPVIVEVWERGIRWYGALLAGGFYISYVILGKMLSKEGFSEKKINNLSVYMILGTILGLRLGHCLFYGPHFDTFTEDGHLLERGYLSHPMDMLKIWEGGLASHGGAMGILLAIGIFAYRNRISYLGILDRIVVIIPLAAVFVRLGNLMNSEILGKITDVPWGFQFLRHDCPPPMNCDLASVPARHPSQLYESIFYLILFVVMIFLYRKLNRKIKEGYLLGIFIFILFSFRFVIEFTKDVQVDFESSMPINMGQVLSIPFVIAGIAIFVIAIKRNKVPEFAKMGPPTESKKKK